MGCELTGFRQGLTTQCVSTICKRTLRRRAMTMAIRTVAIVGCGLMGTGIAEAAVVAGIRTLAIKATGGDPESARRRIVGSLNKAVEKGKLAADVRDRAVELLEVTTDL